MPSTHHTEGERGVVVVGLVQLLWVRVGRDRLVRVLHAKSKGNTMSHQSVVGVCARYQRLAPPGPVWGGLVGGHRRVNLIK